MGFTFRKHSPIETIAEAQRRAKRQLPRHVYVTLLGGNEKGITTEDNLRAFDEIGLIPRVGARIPLSRELSTSFLGVELSMPLLIGPAAIQAVHPRGEVPAARASASVGIAIAQSDHGSSPFEDIAAANPKAFAQMYWNGTRDDMAERVARIAAAGARGLIITLDAQAGTQRRDWGTPPRPEKMNLQTLARFAPMGLSRPAWLIQFLLHGGIPDLRVPNYRNADGQAPTMTDAWRMRAATPLPDWDDISWLRSIWPGPFMVKGVMHPDDAKRAVDSGANAISVSNHGGNNLDGTPSALRVLSAVVEGVGDQIEVAYDGGIRRGTDVAKALSLGARVVLIGRPWIFGLAAAGERGVLDIIEALRSGLDYAVGALGHSSVHELGPSDLILPHTFAAKIPPSQPDAKS